MTVLTAKAHFERIDFDSSSEAYARHPDVGCTDRPANARSHQNLPDLII